MVNQLFQVTAIINGILLTNQHFTEQLIPPPGAGSAMRSTTPQILMACIPGCESIKQVADNQYPILMTAAVGPVKAKFNGAKVSLSPDANGTNAYEI